MNQRMFAVCSRDALSFSSLHQSVTFLLTKRVVSLAAIFMIALYSGPSADAQTLELSPGDHICFIGNTLADRMQHDGWLETEIQVRHPKHQLVIRNLGFSADTLKTRLRSANFRSPDEHLTENKADVIFMMFGYNESFAGQEGLAAFKDELAKQIDHMRGQKYNGKGAPKIVVISPIAHQDLNSANLPDGKENNARIAAYTTAMQSVARKKDCPFVDLFAATQQRYRKGNQPITLNGVHLNEDGNRFVGSVIADALFGKPQEPVDSKRLEEIRVAVKDKCFHWYNYYRITDGYSVYGGRSSLKFINGQTNRDVMKREMEVLFKMTANRDKVVWDALAGKRTLPDDSNTPPFVPVTTNKPGEGPNGEHIYLTGEDAIKRMKVLDGFEVNLFASEEMFPELINPVQMAFDTKGRLWVATWQSYPHWKPKSKMDDRLLILEDTDGDGKADNCKTFAGGLHNPTGFEFWGGGVLVARGPEILFLEDTDNDDVCDKRTIVVHGLDTADTHHTANSFTFGPGGGIYFQEGVFHHTQVETPYGPPIRNINAAVFRFDPRQHDFSVYTPYQYANPHGHVWDRWGQDIIHDGTGAVPYHGALISGHLNFPDKHRSPPKVYQQRTRPCPATEIVSSEHFPAAMQDELLVQNVIGDLGILRYRIDDAGSSFAGTELEPLLLSDDQNFRPVDLEFGPQGELFFTDWQNPVIGHMQHNLRDPSRDQVHGRVYRLINKKAALAKRESVADQPIEALLENLKLPTNRTRYRTRIELSGRDTDKVVAATQKWVDGLDPNHENLEHQLLEALWVFQQHNVLNRELLERVLSSKEFRARAAATRVLCYWRNKMSDAAAMLQRQAGDAHARVRLEAVRAASFLEAKDGIPVVLEAFKHPTDQYIDYVIGETIRAYPQTWKAMVAEEKMLANANERGVNFILSQMSDTEVQRFPMSPQVAEHLLFRTGIGETTRGAAIKTIAEASKQSELDILLNAVEAIDPRTTDGTVTYELVRLMSDKSPAELKTVRQRMENMSRTGKLALLRQIGYVGMITADENVEPTWKAAQGNIDAMIDLVSAVPQIPDPALQAKMFDFVYPLASELPAELKEDEGKSTEGQFIRIELPGKRRILTLAEVEVISGGENVARKGKATQINTVHGAVAARAIDGNTNPQFQANGQTHTRENIANPWWELDLGSPMEIEKVVVFNRKESLGKRLNGFTLKILDSGRNVVFERKGIDAPKPRGSYPIGPVSKSKRLQRAAIDGISYVRGGEPKSFETLANLIEAGKFRDTAVRSLQRIPAEFWNEERVPNVAKILMDEVRKMPAAQRTSATAADRTQLLETMSSMLPAEQANLVRNELAELGVRIIRLGTKPHRMAYDKEIVVVKAGKPIEIIFENTDMMPHNLVITRPGTMQQIGEAAEVMAGKANALAMHYVPRSNKVLLSSKLIQPGGSQKIQFNVPNQPGIYPYVCTYPGHWRRMFGSLIVVRDLDKYNADPQSYLAENKIEIKDELLKLNMRTKTEWKVADFESVFANNQFAGRDFKQGKRMFELASCISCHKMEGKGYDIGPDLTTKLDPKWTAKDILREIIDPSKKIDDEYKTQIFALESGQTVSGIVTFEDDDVIKVVENPLVASEPKVIETFEVEDRKKSDVSAMPKGLLDTLTKEEILDLIAYIVAKGDPQNMLFEGHDH